jgi:hypothetical protein
MAQLLTYAVHTAGVSEERLRRDDAVKYESQAGFPLSRE